MHVESWRKALGLDAAMGALRHLKGAIKKGIVLGASGAEAHCDADYAGDIDTRRSTAGCLLKIAGGVFSWRSRMQPTVACSAAEAECMPAADAVKEMIWMRKMLRDLDLNELLKDLKINCDSQSCAKIIDNPAHHDRSKHIDVKCRFLRDLAEQGEVEFAHCNAEDMIADSLTKAAPYVKREKCCEGMGLKY
eukprot:Plantae.Rhodophyta-Hildenbrandia_rubra.ctg433.p1 GENE.Plantae.Rhodophyta-Hildenbrandia_rubra.ctg433~~Plantae.Rhodophyta-Hildenbrandia_rubra.ctg433.p1  ORF type:complete len:192 (+),score=32.66 Plantae.Rhodophyta-Hildenbrandia_rubra.ctg433:777-1352(+)